MSNAIENKDNVIVMTVEEDAKETKMSKVKKFAKKYIKPVGKAVAVGAMILGAYALGQKSKSKTSADVCEDEYENEYLEEDYEVEDCE